MLVGWVHYGIRVFLAATLVFSVMLQPVAALEVPTEDMPVKEESAMANPVVLEQQDSQEELAIAEDVPVVVMQEEESDIAPSEHVETSTVVAAEVEPSDLPPIGNESQLVISEVRLGGANLVDVGGRTAKEYVTLANISSEDIVLQKWQLHYAKASMAAVSCVASKWSSAEELSGVIEAGKTMSVEISLTDRAAGSVRIVDAANVVHDMVGWGAAPCFETASFGAIPAQDESLLRLANCDGKYDGVDTNNNAHDFVVGTSLSVRLLPECMPPEPEAPGSEEPPLVPTINQCEGLRLSEIGANLTRQFVELRTTLDEPLDVTGCRVMTNRSASKYYALPNLTINPGERVAVYIADTPLTLTKTTTGTVYLLNADGSIEIESQSYANLAAETAWAWFAEGWQQTFTPTPGEVNVTMKYLPCDTGYERNEETGRCKKVAAVTELADCGEGKYRSEETGRCRNITVESALAACVANQYRSPETNRCRNIATASASLTPCKAGQERNPDTNRCRAVATTASASLKPCAAGQERNPATNRCRKVVQGDGSAGFKVVDQGNTADHMASWLALGGVGSMALGYGAWEWRREMWGALGKVFGALPFVK